MNTEQKYIITGTKTRGAIHITFAPNGYIKGLSIKALLNDKKHIAVLKNLPFHSSQLHKLENLGLDVEEVPLDLSFDTFWKTYGNYLGSKVKCRRMWNDLSDTDKGRALNYIPIYKQGKAMDGTAMAYPDTYLRNRLWE